jgi:hypothetical protein
MTLLHTRKASAQAQQPQEPSRVTVEGEQDVGFWVNLAPGRLRVSPVCSTSEQAARLVPFYERTFADRRIH